MLTTDRANAEAAMDPQAWTKKVADFLCSATSSTQLLNRLRDLLGGADAVPARLWLLDSESQTFYPVGHFKCPEIDTEVSAIDGIDEGPTNFLLYAGGDVLGRLTFETAPPSDAIAVVSAILGPLLGSLQVHETVAGDLRASSAQLRQVVKAGNLLRQHNIELLLVEVLQTMMNGLKAEVGAVLTPTSDGRAARLNGMGYS